VSGGNEVFLKTIYPSRKLAKFYLKGWLMNKNEIYSTEEIELFKALEDDVDSGKYTPLSPKELDGKRAFFKDVAVNTIKKK